MAYDPFTTVNIGAYTRAADHNKLGTNIAWVVSLADVDHDFNVTTGTGKHKAIRFDGDNTRDVGESGARAKDVYVGGNIYIGGTGAANALDDYEEGTWTPRLSATSGGTPGTHTYSLQVGSYTKVGNLCTVHCLMTLSAKDGAALGSMAIAGFPFTAKTTPASGAYTTLVGSAEVDFDSSTVIMGTIGVGQPTIMQLLGIVDAGAFESVTEADIENTSQIRFSFSYPV